MCEHGVPGRALNLGSTSYPDHGRYGDLPLQGNNPTAEPEIKPGTSWLVVRSSDHQAMRLVRLAEVYVNWLNLFKLSDLLELSKNASELNAIPSLQLSVCGRN
jgi:hypothetical protein